MKSRPHKGALCLLLVSGILCARAAAQPNDRPAREAPPSAAAAADRAPAPSSADAGKPPTGDSLSPSSSNSKTTQPPLPPQENRRLGAAPPSRADPSRAAREPGGGSWILKTLTALGVVIALVLLIRIALARMGGQAVAYGGAGLVEVLARTTVAPRTHILFLRINQRIIVASQTSAGLSPLTELSESDDVAWLLGRIEASRPTSISRGFKQFMNRFERDYPQGTETESSPAEGRLDRTRHELSGLLSRVRTINRGG